MGCEHLLFFPKSGELTMEEYSTGGWSLCLISVNAVVGGQ